MKHTHTLLLMLSAFLLTRAASASEVFVEAETFQSVAGWEVVSGPDAKTASGLAMLSGSRGATDGVATKTVSVKDAGHYRIWVRYLSHPRYRGPFHVTMLAGGRVLADGLFDTEFAGGKNKPVETWKSLEADLPEGEVTIRLSKHESKNSPGASRRVDCLLLTMDEKLVPNHLAYGAQTYLRVTLGEGYDKPLYLHIFADHFHAPWYQHYALGRSGAFAAVSVKKSELLKSGERTAWCNITPMIYQDSGAMLHITARHAYTEYADRLRATFEIATAPDEKSIVRTLNLDNKPGTVSIFFPPNLLTPENLALCKTDLEIANATGKLADAYAWPTHGKPLQKFPFFVSANIDNSFTPPSEPVAERERKTLSYFGFTDEHHRRIGGAWLMKDGSFCNPDIEKMRARFQDAAAKFKESGGKLQDIVYCELTDEPTGQPLEFCAKDPAYAEHFRAWIKSLGISPADLLVKDWDAVKMVTPDQRDQSPALYYFSQRFRTRALGDFMATQRKLAEQAYARTFPVLVNFSDGAVYTANFYKQGVDYFELLDSGDQNAIWGEDWSNGASTYQCASYNVDLMRAAARERGQIIGHHLIAYAGRKPWDIKLKATSETARGVKILNNFAYGPIWATHEGGPYWRTSAWQGKPETWGANAALTREIGAVEDMLLPAMPAPAKVALLYSSASDAWTVDGNLAYGFDRMHTWLALAHAQTPVDIVAERQVSKGALDGYSVCYLSGPNLTISAAAKLKTWVENGGTLWLTAGAASRDEYNRPLHLLDSLLPAERGEVVELQKQVSSGRTLAQLSPKDVVRWDGGSAEVLSVKQPLTARAGSEILATFNDHSPALLRSSAAKGTVYCAGFLPALAYIKPALEARNVLQKKADEGAALTPAEQQETPLLARTSNPWKFPKNVRDLILLPVHGAKIAMPITCNTALVDAVYMPHATGILIPLANYTAQPIAHLELIVSVPKSVASVESAVQGRVTFEQVSPQQVKISLPLDSNDFVKIVFR